MAENTEKTKTNVGAEAIPEILDIHGTLPTQIAILGGKYVIIAPSVGYEKTGKITFRVKTDACQFLNPSHTYLIVVSKILDSKGKGIKMTVEEGGRAVHAADSDVLFVNGISTAWFKNVEIKINGQIVDFGDNLYMYRADLETKLSYPRAVKEGFLSICGWDEEDTPFDSLDRATDAFPTDPAEVRDDGKWAAIFRRYLKTVNGRAFYTVGKIHSPIFDQPKLLPDHLDLEISLDRNSEEFVLLSKNDNPKKKYDPTLDSIRLLVKIENVDEDVCKDIKSFTFAGQSYLFPIRRVRMTTFTHPTGGQEMLISDLLTGEKEVPKRLFFAFVRESARTGHYQQDPFNYQHYQVQAVSVRVGGEARPYPQLEIDYTSGDYTLPLLSLMQTVGTAFGGEEIGITMENYISRNCIYGFNLSGYDSEPGRTFELAEHKTVSLYIRFGAVPDHPITLIVYAEYGGEIEITADNKVIMHPNA